MTSLALRNANAMRAGQVAWGNMTPPDDGPAFLETAEGDNWLHEKACAMVGGDDLLIRSPTVRTVRVEVARLHQAVRDHLSMLDDEEYHLEQMLTEIARRGPGDKLFGMLQGLLGKTGGPSTWTVVHDLATNLIAPHAEAAAQAMRENDFDID
ncbi:hypothetical protein D3C76_538190 [compost metagenome]